MVILDGTNPNTNALKLHNSTWLCHSIARSSRSKRLVPKRSTSLEAPTHHAACFDFSQRVLKTKRTIELACTFNNAPTLPRPPHLLPMLHLIRTPTLHSRIPTQTSRHFKVTLAPPTTYTTHHHASIAQPRTPHPLTVSTHPKFALSRLYTQMRVVDAMVHFTILSPPASVVT